MARLLVGPFNRVEGDLEVSLDIRAGRVQRAQVNATMYRGFEQTERERRNQVAGDGIGHHGRHRDVDDVIAGGLAERLAVVAKEAAEFGHGVLSGWVGYQCFLMIIILICTVQ